MREIIIQILIRFNSLICRREPNQVARVLGIYQRKRAGLLLEIDEKPELLQGLQRHQWSCFFY